jgi:hypothetical protein
MAGDWFPIRTDLWDDPRVVRMAFLLKATRAAVVGACQRTWALANLYTTDGRLVGYTAETLDVAVELPGWSEAMAAVGWLLLESEAVIVPDFEKFNGQGAKRRAQQRERMRSVRNSCASDAHKKRTIGEGENRTEQEENRTAFDVGGAMRFEGKRREAEEILKRISHVVRCRHANDWSLVGKVALLVAVGEFSEDDLMQALEAVTGTGTEKGAAFGREAGTRRRLQDDGGVEYPSSARGCLNAELTLLTGMLSCEGEKAVERKTRGDEEPGGGRRPRCKSAYGARATRWPTRGRSLPQVGSVPQNVRQSEGEG